MRYAVIKAHRPEFSVHVMCRMLGVHPSGFYAWLKRPFSKRADEGFAYLAVVIDLFSRRVVGWAMQGRQTTDLVLQALSTAIWRRKPDGKVLIHSDQG